jgi:hypothetical protein
MVLVIFFALLHSSVFAWNESTLIKWREFSETYSKPFSDPSFSTFWGGLRRGFHWKNHRGSMVELTDSRFEKPVPVYISANSLKKDLIIFFPGVFGKPDGRISPHVIDELERANAHVAVIPNIVAPTYLKSKRMNEADALVNEMANQRAIVQAIIQKIEEKNIAKIHIIAESLGSLQALITFLPGNNAPEIHSMTIIWPPLYLDRALKRFDQMIEKTAKIYEGCLLWWKWPWMLKEVKFSPLPLNLGEEDKSCFGAWVISQGFVQSIQSTTKEVFDSKKIELQTIPQNFSQFVQIAMPDFRETLEKGEERFTFLHLLGHYRPLFPKLRLVSSHDDFLNHPTEWDELWGKYPELKSNHYLFKWGGHSGPAALEGFFEQLLHNIFP